MKNLKSGRLIALYTSALAITFSAGITSEAASTDKKPAATTPARLQEGFNEPLVLSGLKILKIAVGELDPYLLEQGLAKDKLEEYVTEGLSPTHITICGEEDCCSKNGGKGCNPDNTAILYLKIKSHKDKNSSKGTAYAVALNLVEKARIARAKKDLMVSVWSAQSVASTEDDIKGEVKDEIQSLMGQFLRDYRLANSADLNHIDIPAPGESKRPGYKVK